MRTRIRKFAKERLVVRLAAYVTVIGVPSALRATDTLSRTRLLPGTTSACQPNQGVTLAPQEAATGIARRVDHREVERQVGV